MEIHVDPLWEKVRDKKNVVGYSKSLKPRIKNGKEIPGSRVFRIYVSKKQPEDTLSKDDIIPKIIDGIETDIVEIGKVKAQNVESG